MALASSFCLLPCFAKTTKIKTRLQVRAKNRGSADAEKKERERDGTVVGGGNERSKPRVERKWMEDVVVSKDLELLWDDGYRTKTINDYLDGAVEMIKPDGGPPRWFFPLECGESLKGSPVLLFLPGIDGVGLGLVLHHKALGKVFDVRCLHIPVHDRTPFQGLVKLVEETVRLEYSINPDKPIYLVGDSFGCCLALAVAALNPKIDLVLVLANPATSFGRSQLRSIFPALEALPNELQMTVSLLLSSLLCNPLKMVMANVEYKLPPSLKLEQMSGNFGAFLHRLSVVTDIFPMEMLLWKLQLIKSGAAYANSRLHAVKAEVLVLASGNDNVLPSGDEAERLKSSLKNCIFRYFKDNGHALLMEAGISLLTIIKCTQKYRRSRRHDHILDFIPPSMLEVRTMFGEVTGMFQWAVGSAMFSTLEDGKIVRGLAGVPDEGPVLLVGYHMMWGMELYQLFEQFIKEKKVLLRGVAHPLLFSEDFGRPLDINILDWFKVMGALPVTGSNIFKLLARKSHVLLYPGGAREAFHNKGEEYKLFWPDQPEFVRMAARFGATIVPFGVVGEDDVARHVLDYHDLVKLPFVNGYIKETQQKMGRVRGKSQGEVGNLEGEVFFPVPFPKYPGRLYYLFGKPIRTEGMKEILNDREKANQIYLQIKSDVEQSLAYLLKKREEDPYRGLLDRTVYRAMFSSHDEVPTFDM